jgi:Uma2 family endonuclease
MSLAARNDPPRMTKEEFYRWAERQPFKYELVDGVPVPLHFEIDEDGQIRAMTAAMPNHYAVMTNIAVALRRRAPEHCRVLTGGAAVQVGVASIREPDIVLLCGGQEADVREVQHPTLIVEVLSPSTSNIDRGDKLYEYQELAEVREVWLVDSRRRAVTVASRGDGVWISRTVIGQGEFPSEVLRDRLTMDEIYEGVEV